MTQTLDKLTALITARLSKPGMYAMEAAAICKSPVLPRSHRFSATRRLQSYA